MEPINNQNFSGILRTHLLYITHQFLREMNLWSTCHEFEREHAIYFDMDYFKELIIHGSWNELEHYLGGFTTFQSNNYSKKLFFEIRKQKYLEALHIGEHEHAKDILNGDLLEIISEERELFDQLFFLQYLDDFRSHLHLRDWVDVRTSRNILIDQLPNVVTANADLNTKLILPHAASSTLVALARQSFETQFARCPCPRSQRSLLRDHTPQQCRLERTDLFGLAAPAPARSVGAGPTRDSETALRRIVRNPASRPHLGARTETVTPPTLPTECASAGRTPTRATVETTTGVVSPPSLSPERASAGATSRRASAARVSASRLGPEPRTGGPSLPLPISSNNGATHQRASAVRKQVSRPSPMQITGDSLSSLTLVRKSFDDSLNIAACAPLQTATTRNVQENSVTLNKSSCISVAEEPNAGAISSRDGGAVGGQKRVLSSEEENGAASLNLNSQPQSDKNAAPSRCTGHQFAVVIDPGRVKTRTLSVPAISEAERVHKVMYNKSGKNLIALSGSGQHLVWQWERSASVEEEPTCVRPFKDMKLINDQPVEGEERSHCFDFTNNQLYFLSASGARVHFYSAQRWMQLPKYMEKSYTITSLATSPQDNNLVAVGTSAFRIEVIQLSSHQAKHSFKGHGGRVTSMEFSRSGKLLVSAGADRKVIVWDLKQPKKKTSILLPGKEIFQEETHIQLHKDGLQILAVHESLLAILDIKSLKFLMKWELPVKCAALSHAAFASHGEQIFAGAEDGSVWVFNASDLQPRVRIAPEAYQDSFASELLIPSVLAPHPSALAPHPEDQDHVALGMSNGPVILLEVPDKQKETPEAADPKGKADRPRKKRGRAALEIGLRSKGKTSKKGGDAH